LEKIIIAFILFDFVFIYNYTFNISLLSFFTMATAKKKKTTKKVAKKKTKKTAKKKK